MIKKYQFSTYSILENQEVEIETLKEELKLKNPNYARAQQRFQQKCQTKIPEMIMIPNK